MFTSHSTDSAMNLIVVQLIFFAISIFFTFRNVQEKYFSNKVKNISFCKISQFSHSQTTVTYFTRELSEINFPVYFTFASRPGFNDSLLREFGFDGEYYFFSGENYQSNLLSWARNGETVESTFQSFFYASKFSDYAKSFL